MKTSFFRKTAWSNIRKNYRFFVPRILAETGLLACFYIALTLAMDYRITDSKCGSYVPFFMIMGMVVLVVLSVIIMFYANSFLMKQRKREFGLYNVLGMEKKHVCRVLFHEGFICCLISTVAGLGLGILLYKLCSLLICKILRAQIALGFYYIRPVSIIPAALFFVVLDLITYAADCKKIKRMKPVELMSSKHTGEREPKVKWLMLFVGIAALAGGYYISVSCKSPIAAVGWFFPAVFLVILGTYFLFVTGSTFVLKALKNNKRYYYSKRHMPAISGLLYRMKQNAVGLASIAILATGVLVMVSTTVSLYAGMQDTIEQKYPDDFYVSGTYQTKEGTVVSVPAEKLEEIVRQISESIRLDIDNVNSDNYLSVSYCMDGNVWYAKEEMSDVSSDDLDNVAQFTFITEKTYSELTGEMLGLTGHELALCRISSNVSNLKVPQGEITIHGVKYMITQSILEFPARTDFATGVFNYGVVMADSEAYDELVQNQIKAYGTHASYPTERLRISFSDTDRAAELSPVLDKEIITALKQYMKEDRDADVIWYNLDSVWDASDSLVGMYGTLLFLGILLGTVCMFITVLIIYYKQISEGYEDRDRFQIMEKIGMSRAEVKKTINTQVLFVFFLPLVVAGIHMAFAYPILKLMLDVLMLNDPRLFIICSLIAYGLFAVIYVLIYSGTSRTYYKIVH